MAGFKRAKRGVGKAQSAVDTPNPTDDSPQFWFNTKTLKVERGLKAAAVYRIGPFSTEAEAANALELVKLRALAWAKDDTGEGN